MGGGTNTTGGPKKLLMAFGVGLVVGYLVCHFHVCAWVGLCEAVAVHPIGPLDPGPK